MSDPIDDEGRLSHDETLDELETAHLIDLVREANLRASKHATGGRMTLATLARTEAEEFASVLRSRGVTPPKEGETNGSQ